jgi:transcriptional regulator with XRE-family HTH domain
VKRRTNRRLREARIKVGLSQKELADKLGLTQPTISNWEKGRGAPSEEQEERLQQVLGSEDETQRGLNGSPLGAWLTKARISKGWSVPELAHKAGLTAPAIYRIEAGGTRNLRDSTRKKLERALNNKLPADAAAEVAEEAKITGLGKLEGFDPHLDSERPDEAGIYMLYDISERPVYVGEGSPVTSIGVWLGLTSLTQILSSLFSCRRRLCRSNQFLHWLLTRLLLRRI